MAAQIDPQVVLNAVKAEFDLLSSTIKDKGAKRFGKAAGIGAAFIFAAYYFVYMPPQAKISRLSKEIDAARAMSEAGSKYQDLRNTLAGSYGGLPLLKDQQQWLNNAVIDSLRADGLTPETYRPVVETESSGLIFQTSTVQLTVKFNDVYAWLLRLESAKPLMHVAVLEVTKKTDILGMNTVSASIMTAIPKKRFN
jgi:type II secretory pathway component PulM